MKVTLKDVAAKAGVSVSTVSRVLNGDSFKAGSRETQERVWKAAKELGYIRRKSAAAKRALPGSYRRIGCIIENTPRVFDHPFYSVILNGIEKEAKAQGYSIGFTCTQKELDDPVLLHKMLTDEQADGVIVIAIHLDESLYNDLKNHFGHVVFIDNRNPKLDADVIVIEREESAYQAVRYLIGLGHTRIGYIGSTLIGEVNSHLTQEERFIGYKRAMEEAGLSIDEELVKDGHWSLEGGFCAMKEILAAKEVPTAIFSASDLMAIGALRASQEAGLRTPHDISIVSYDDIEIAAYTSPPLTTVHVPKKELGQTAVRTLVQRINGELNLPLKIILPTRLVERESACKVQS